MRLDPSPAATRGFVMRAALPLVAALVLSACAGMNATQPQATLLKAPALGLSADPSTVLSLQDAWWREFGDAQLNRLIDSALASNPSLKNSAGEAGTGPGRCRHHGRCRRPAAQRRR